MSNRVHSKVILDYPSIAPIYYLCRFKDTEGQGWIKLSLTETLEFFNTSISSLKRWLKKGKQLNFFLKTEINSKADKLYVKYKTIKSFKKDEEGVVASFITHINDLKDRRKIKELCYEATLGVQQVKCEKAIMSKYKDSRFLFAPTQASLKKNTVKRKINRNLKIKGNNNPLFYTPKGKRKSSTKRAGCVFVNPHKSNFFIKSYLQPLGASQITVAKLLNKSRKTVNKYVQKIRHIHVFKELDTNKLSNSQREKLPPNLYHIHDDNKWTAEYIIYRKEYRFTKQSYDGYFKQMPNYYYISLDVKKEKSKKLPSKTFNNSIFTNSLMKPKVGTPEYFDYIREENKRCFTDFNLLQETIPNTTKNTIEEAYTPIDTYNLSFLLETVFNRDTLINTAHWICLTFKSQSAPPQIFKFSDSQISSSIVNTYKILDKEQQILFSLYIENIKKNIEQSGYSVL